MGINVVDIPQELFEPQPAPPAPHPVEPDFWHGRFFPNNCTAFSGEFERTGARLVLPIDYMPTARSLRMAEEFHGPRCRETILAWKGIWEAALGEDVDVFVEREAPKYAQTTETWAERLRKSSAGHLDSNRHSDAAKILYDVLQHRESEPPRDPAHHVLQDAVRHLTLLEEGAPFALCLDPSFVGERKGLVFVPNGKGGLVLAEQGSEEKRTALKALSETSVASDPYWNLRAFRERAGRPMAVTRGIKHLVVTLLDMSRQGHAKAFVKGCPSKSGTWVVDLHPTDDTHSIKERLLTVIGLTTTYYSTWSEMCFLVQGHVPFVREHRFLVVRHRVVASTASDRNLGVLDADPTRIIGTGVAQLRLPANEEGSYDRGVADVVVDRPLLARMARGARDLARAMRKGLGDPLFERGRPDCYCIDMGETADVRVLPIETNSLSRCGLYAADFRRVARAVARRAAAAKASALAEAKAREDEAKEYANLEMLSVAPGRRSPYDLIREIERDEARWRPIEGILPTARRRFPANEDDGARNTSRPAFIESTLDVHDRTGWPLVGITRRANVSDGIVGDGEVVAWAVQAPDGRLVHGTKVHADIRHLVDDFSISPVQGNPDLALGRIERTALVSLLDERCPDWRQGQVDDNLIDVLLARLDVRLRPEITPSSLADMGIAAVPGLVMEDCLDAAARRMDTAPGVRMLDVPMDREIALHGTDAFNLQGKVAVTLMALHQDPYGPPVPSSWSATNQPDAGDHWPIPLDDRRPRLHGGRPKGGLTDIWTPMETARIAMALAAHTRRVRIVACLFNNPAMFGLAAIRATKPDGSGGVDAGDLWDLCTAHVICGQVPPTRLVTEALLAGPPPSLLPEVAAAVRRSHEAAKAAHEIAQARIAAIPS